MIKDFPLSEPSRLLKVAASICFILLTISVISAWSAPAVNYEPSIYRSTPAILWVSIILSVLFGVILVLLHVSAGKEAGKQSYLGAVGILLILLSYATAVSLYIVRGYYLWGANADPAAHIGLISQLLGSGFIDTVSIYPVVHVYLAEICLLTNGSLIYLQKLVPLLFDLLFILFMYILAKRLLPDHSSRTLALICVCAPITGWCINLTPNHLANFLFPLALYVIFSFYSTYEIRWGILSVIMILLFPFFHPIPTLILLVITFTLSLASILSARLSRQNQIPKYTLLLPIFLLLWFFIWFTSFEQFLSRIALIFTTLLDLSSSELTKILAQADYAQSYGYNIYDNLLKIEGGVVLFFLASVLSLPYVLKLRTSHRPLLLLVYAALFFICAIMVLSLVLKVLFNPTRFIFYTLVFSMLLSGIFLLNVVGRISKIKAALPRAASLLLLAVVLTAIFVNGVFIIYPSPYALGQGLSQHTTRMEISGMSWLFSAGNNQSDLTSMTMGIFRYAQLLPDLASARQKRIPMIYPDQYPDRLKVPYHFDYAASSQKPPDNLYLVLREADKTLYTDVYPEMAGYRFTPGDFDAFDDGSLFRKVYTNGGLDLYYR